MEVKLAKTAGFCMGVKLAMDKVLTLSEQADEPVYTHGPLIHNRQAIEMLEARGVRDIEKLPEAAAGSVVIRAHGVPDAVRESLRSRGLKAIDATCPHVLASQRHIERYAARGYTIVIAGDKEHAEVEGLKSHAGPRCVVVSTPAEAEAAAVAAPACLVAQTTFSEEAYDAIAAILRTRVPGIEVLQTICQATRERQREVTELAAEVDAMVVVGGRHSANTCRLAEISRLCGKPTFHVETADELDAEALAQFAVVGLTAGASTPNWITRSVLQALEDLSRREPRAQWLSWRALAALTRSNVYSALATVALAYASCQLLGIAQPSPLFLLAPFCYVFAITTLNRLSLGERGVPHPPPRVAFYHRHPRPLLATSALFALGSLASLALARAWTPLVLLLIAYASGVAYSVRLVPRGLRGHLRVARLKDLPASKDLFISVGWMVVCVIVPWAGEGGRASPALIVACGFAFVLTFVKASLVNLGDMQEDRLLGRETLPILLGADRTRALLAALAVLLAVVLAAAPALGWAPRLAWGLLACPAYLLAHLRWRVRRGGACDVVYTLIADGTLLLAGVLALGWRYLLAAGP
ncbi:MAG TPA: 4-hydroxy-3-methylbut-2-enyl diphosphate reductase [Planctomycetota bacterium]|nr:4-hydroxy-3-methylbut-2-enyl diphosphate reductase [Planctomycetota bacterium]HRR83278.1 4-hydroxy-3-methylbut-2-enyl diphosphate reductase [Planctomycetota bacterium]HRT94494.1 4-hydroxy-3-methylbut-2-enyl diphosphate reductase [Planctomycetota bacterium]